jgi:AcrR family transcriptional regulator
VARQADVARATVYYQFGSKRAPLEAVADDIQRRAGQQQTIVAVELAGSRSRRSAPPGTLA